MKIEYVDKFDLYEKGNYISSFNSYDEILDFFEIKKKHFCMIFSSSYDFESSMNSSCYSVIQSKHLKFS